LSVCVCVCSHRQFEQYLFTRVGYSHAHRWFTQWHVRGGTFVTYGLWIPGGRGVQHFLTLFPFEFFTFQFFVSCFTLKIHLIIRTWRGGYQIVKACTFPTITTVKTTPWYPLYGGKKINILNIGLRGFYNLLRNTYLHYNLDKSDCQSFHNVHRCTSKQWITGRPYNVTFLCRKGALKYNLKYSLY